MTSFLRVLIGCEGAGTSCALIGRFVVPSFVFVYLKIKRNLNYKRGATFREPQNSQQVMYTKTNK